MIEVINVSTLHRHAAQRFMDELVYDYGYGITKTISEDGYSVNWKIECSSINEERDVVADRLERWMSHEYWFLNIE